MAEYIKREYAVDAVADVYYNTPDINLSYEKFEAAISKIPSSNVAPVKHGQWIGSADGYADGELVYDMWECSECGYDADGAEEKPSWGYCPNCGAKMDGE